MKLTYYNECWIVFSLEDFLSLRASKTKKVALRSRRDLSVCARKVVEKRCDEAVDVVQVVDQPFIVEPVVVSADARRSECLGAHSYSLRLFG